MSIMRKNFNIMRNLRIQLKTGYLLTPPDEYEFMIRCPPLTPQNKDRLVKKFPTAKIPYIKYYKQAVERNPVFVDESVYPAYWQDEPLGMILAKKQYELIQAGKSEEDAYREALKHIDTLESSAFDKMAEVHKYLKEDRQGVSSITTDPEVAKKIHEWRAVVKKHDYSNLHTLYQAQIDHFIQTKILKWSEVERERRMKDQIFVNEFESLRSALFPDAFDRVPPPVDPIVQAAHIQDLMKKKAPMAYELASYETPVNSKPFYYEDYSEMFRMAKANYKNSRWPGKSKEKLTRWIEYAVLSKGAFARQLGFTAADNFKIAKNQFFPFFGRPVQEVDNYSLPSVEDMRKLLYKNDIGYKQDVERDTAKMFIKRFYKIPMLLFPKETFWLHLIKSPGDFIGLIKERKSLKAALADVGLDESFEAEIMQRLQEIANRSKRSQEAAKPGAAGTSIAALARKSVEGRHGGEKMSVLDGLIQSLDDEAVRSPRDDKYHEASFDNSDNFDDFFDRFEENEERVARSGLTRQFLQNMVADAINNPDNREIDPEWESLDSNSESVGQRPEFAGMVDTAYVAARESMLDVIDQRKLTDATSELHMQEIADTRKESEVIMRARLGMEFERKEAIRRKHEWKERNVISSYRAPHLELHDTNSF